ncbi:cobalamin biosynthesis protein [Micromonosporaceae bacterium DT194]|uniref:cobalamin biosynthesis protein n=1 Tax=Melissospora conviva TaxID=3388432 RepID=UPI003C230718
MQSTVATAAGMAAGYVLDALFGDPRRRRLPTRIRLRPGKGGPGSGEHDTRPRQGKSGPGAGAPEAEAGAVPTALTVAAPVLLAAATAAVTVATRRQPAARAAVTALGVWAAVRAREVSRDVAGRGPGDCAQGVVPAEAAISDRSHRARASVETLALRTCGQVVAPLFWTGVAGLPGLTAQHLIRSAHRRALRSGEPALVRVTGGAVSLVDAVPARLTGLLTVAAAPLAGGSTAEAWRIWRRDRHDHPVAGAGQSQAALAGALRVRLGGPSDSDAAEASRPFIGDGPRPQEQHLRRAARLARVVGLGALAVSAGLCVARGVLITGIAARRTAPAAAARAAHLPHRFGGPAS